MLFRDDLERILAMCQKLGGSEDRPLLKGPTWESTDIQELHDHEGVGPLKHLEIEHSSEGGFLHIEIQPTGIRLYIDDITNPRKRGVFEEVDEQIRNGRRAVVARLLTAEWLLGAYGVSAAIGILVGVLGRGGGSWTILIAGTVALLGAVGVWATWTMSFERSALVHLDPRHQRPTFVERNKDQLILMVVSALLGALVTLAVMVLT